MVNYAYKGDAVEVAGWGVGYVYRITRGATPYHVRLVEGARAGEVVKCASRHMSEVDADTKARIGKAYRDSLLEESELFHELVLGMVVTFDSPRYNPSGDLYVVIGGVKDGRVKIAKLGGDGNRYITAALGSVAVAWGVDVVRGGR